MRRRTLLAGSTLLVSALTLRPGRGEALGGEMPPIGSPAPPFTLQGVDFSQEGDPQEGGPQQPAATRGSSHSLADWKGSWLVLYFYPKDFTGGCTLEARGFQKDLLRFRRLGAAVVGISADDGDTHASFCSSESLAFPLLSDPDGGVSRRYGSWIAPYSRRHTFLIDPGGIVRARWSAVHPAGHSAEVLAELERLQQAG